MSHNSRGFQTGRFQCGRYYFSLAVTIALLLTARNSLAGTWGLLASPGHENQPTRGVYFFPGDPKRSPGDPRPPHGPAFTSISDNTGRDYQWDESLIARNQVVGEIAAVGANVIFAEYNGAYSDIHFVTNTESDFLAVFTSSRLVNGPLVIPSLEASTQCGGSCKPGVQPTFDPVRDIAPATQVGRDWVTHLVQTILLNRLQDRWAQIYDSSGAPRFAIQIAQATSNNLAVGEDTEYFAALKDIQLDVWNRTGIHIGFILTPVEDENHYSIIRTNPDRVAPLQQCAVCLAVLPYFSELPRTHTECEDQAFPGLPFRGFIDCNKGGHIANLSRLKKDRTKLWVNSGIPYYLDLDAGYDAHLVFNERPLPGVRSSRALWGETAYVYDAWRNSQSELKGHQGDGNRAPAGVVYNSWNGYTEVSVALESTHLPWDPSFQVPVCQTLNPCVPTGGTEPLGPPYSGSEPDGRWYVDQRWLAKNDFKDIRIRWLTDVFSVDPRLCDHYYYENGQRKFHVIGAICEKFTEKYGEYGPLGPPASDAYRQGNWTVEDFQNGQIYWNSSGAHEMHGGIFAKYKTLLQSGRNLGAPLTDELTTPDQVGRFNHFEGGSIYWTPRNFGVGIWGPFRDRWAALQYERGRLRYPVLEPTQSDVRQGWFARFDGGNMYAVSSSAPAFEVWGSILAEYGRLGWERSWLGYPLSGELDTGYWCAGGRYNRFQNGFIDWCPGHNACSHRGDGRCDDGRARPNS